MTNSLPCQIAHIELSEGVPALSVEPPYQRLYVCFWWRQIPLGHAEFRASQLPMSPAQVANAAARVITPAVGAHLIGAGFQARMPQLPAKTVRHDPPELEALLGLAQPLQQLEKKLCKTEPRPCEETVSVAVCTRERPEQLEGCLRSLLGLSRAPLEIIVVDNAPRTEATRRLVARMPGIRYVCEPRPGLDIARNAAIRHTRGEIIAFTDDDVLVHPDWVARIAEPFEDPQVMAVTGLILPAELETPAQVLFEKTFGGFNRGFRPRLFNQQHFQRVKHKGAAVWEIGAGANMALRRTVVGRIGAFDERLDVGAAGCSGDSEFWYRILAEGWSCAYHPAAVVLHYHRRDLDSLRQQMRDYMRGHVAAALIQFERYRDWGNLRHLFLGLPRAYARWLGAGLLQGFPQENRMLLTGARGCASGVKYYFLDRWSR